MPVCFHKWQALGNDFIIIEGVPDSYLTSIIDHLCHRREGIGADGVIFLDTHAKCPKMVFFNADGSQAEMCGNGLRVVMRYLETRHKPLECELAGRTYLGVYDKNRLYITMPTPELLDFNKAPYKGIWVKAGVPHFLIETPSLKEAIFDETDFANRYHSAFNPHGSNLTFYQKIGSDIHLRTLERGVDEETSACGSAAVACSILSSLDEQRMIYLSNQEVWVRKKEGQVFLSGDAKWVFSGSFVPSDFV